MGTIRFDIVKGPSAFGLMDMFLNAYNGNLDFVYFVIKRNEIKKRLVGVVIETIYHMARALEPSISLDTYASAELIVSGAMKCASSC